MITLYWQFFYFNPQGKTPLHFAAEEGEPQCITILLTAGATIDKEDNQVMWFAIYFCNISSKIHFVRSYMSICAVTVLYLNTSLTPSDVIKMAQRKLPKQLSALL